ncbi:MAG: glycosyltransferase family 39 protein [Desulfurococcales archaeon]|nr:glycosyltransferase family 39 protein [Desulfurococcales archaeon]
MGINDEPTTRRIELATLGLFIYITSWLWYVNNNRAWLPTLTATIEWLESPHITYGGSLHPPPVPVDAAIPVAIALLVACMLVGARPLTEFLASATLVFMGITGWTTMVLGILGHADRMVIDAAMALELAAALVLFTKFKCRGSSGDGSSMGRRFSLAERLILPVILLAVAMYFWHSLLYPVDGWDELIYHATMAKVLYLYHGFPTLVGPSVGIEMSSNYPALYPSIAGYFYITTGMVDDFYLRLVSPLAAAITLYYTYRIASHMEWMKYPLLAPFILAITPEFVNHAFQSNNYMLLTAFFTMTLYHTLRYRGSRDYRILMLLGLTMGFMASTNYEGILLAAIALALTLYWMKPGRGEWRRLLYPSLLLAAVAVPWYVRNIVRVGDPLYPFLTNMIGLHTTTLYLLRRTMEGIKSVSMWVAFGKPNPGPLDYLYLLTSHRGLYPSIALALWASITLLLASKRRSRDTGLILAVLAVITVFAVNGFFLRYLLPVMPVAAAYTLYLVKDAFPRGGGDGLRAKIAVATVLLVIVLPGLLFPGLPVLIGGRSFIYHSPQIKPGGDFTYYIAHPGMDWTELMKHEYGEDAYAWIWLNEHLKPGQKILTMDHRIYYVAGGDPLAFIFLDSDEAIPLITMNDPKAVLDWLRERNVEYIFLSGYPLPAHLQEIPLVKMLGSPLFPVVHWASNPGSRVYHVGPVRTPITSQEEVYINTDQWLGPVDIAGRRAMYVGPIETLAPRIYVSADCAYVVNVTYLDRGEGALDINLYSPSKDRWYLGLANIFTRNTSEWKTISFITPPDPAGYVVLGLHAYSYIYISNITAEPVTEWDRYCLYNVSNRFNYGMSPPAIVVYLPPLTMGDKIIVEAESNMNISVEVFQGLIGIDEMTKWWEKHQIIARNPQLPVMGTHNPTLEWSPNQPGLYTLLIVQWSQPEDREEPLLKISISAAIK